MLNPSEALRPTTVAAYFKKEYSLASNSYFTETGTITGHWRGRLAREIGLTGAVTEEAFTRLAEGKDPFSGDRLIEHRSTKDSKPRAGWDLVANAPKSVSLAALIGGDHRIIEAHRLANAASIDAMERFVQQRMGGNLFPVTTGKFIVASFQHDVARPDAAGYPAPHLHTHNVLVNMTAIDGDSQARAIQSRAIYAAQKFGTAVYQAELEWRLRGLGYDIVHGKANAPEIKGFTAEYLAAESPRALEIGQRMEQLGISGSRAARLIARQDRNEKLDLTPAELKALHLTHAEQYGNQPQGVVEQARINGHRFYRSPEQLRHDAYAAVEYARTKLSERTAVFDDHELMSQALRYRSGKVRLGDVEEAVVEHRLQHSLIPVGHVKPDAPGFRYTTPEMIRMERELLAWATRGRETVQSIAPHESLSRFRKLDDNEPRKRVIQGFLATTDQVTLLKGGAGTGKTSAMGMLTEIARERGYKVVGLAPVSKAVAAMREQGIDAQTLQRFVKRDKADDDRKRLFLLDEASLAPTLALHQFMQKVRPQDHVVFIGDTRQHTPVQAGFVFEQLVEAGVRMAELNKNYRQQPGDLKLAVNLMAKDRLPDALTLLDHGGHIHQYTSKHDRYQAIAQAYAEQPAKTIVVSPDNKSRAELNGTIREELRAQGFVGNDKYVAGVLVPRDVYDEDRKLAETYRVGDTVRYHQEHRRLKIQAKSYSTVTALDPARNEITVKLESGRSITYDPKRAYGVSLYETKELPLAIGDRIQFTASTMPFSNRDMGEITALDNRGYISVHMDDGRTTNWNLKYNRHIDYAYSSTSHAAQGSTVDRALINIEVMNSHVDPLLDRAFTYVAGSRPRYELQLFVDNKAELENKLCRTHEKYRALSIDQIAEYRHEREPLALAV